MRNSAVIHLPGLLAVLALFLPGGVAARAAGVPAGAEDYGRQVAADMRDLVPEATYQALLRELDGLPDPIGDGPLLGREAAARVAASPCGASMAFLARQYAQDPATRAALERINRGFQDLPAAYPGPNPWQGQEDATHLLREMLSDFTDWCTFLPEISGNQDSGLRHILNFAWFYYRNPAAQDFVQGRDPNRTGSPLVTGLKFTRDFSNQRGAFMNSGASAAKVAQWVGDPRIEIEDYVPTAEGGYEYATWNEFFARQIKIDTETRTIPSRPVTMPLSQYPERDYIVVSPTDCIMNPLVQVLQQEGASVRRYVENPLQEDLVLDVKNIPVGLMALLGNAPDELKRQFVGGTGLSCVLMPNTYHHFHSPVNGTIVHAEIVASGTYGYEDFPNWVPPGGNVGRPGTDFSQFQVFQRGVVVIEVRYQGLDGNELTGYVASIPVGLDTIGSVVLDEGTVPGKAVKRGYTRLGNFFYGGSLNILLFSKGLASGVVQTRLGSQITLFNLGREP